METLIISAVNFYDCSNFNRKKGALVLTTLPRSSIRHTISIPYFCADATLLGNGRYKSNWKLPLRSRLLYPYKSLREIFVDCGLYCMIGDLHTP